VGNSFPYWVQAHDDDDQRFQAGHDDHVIVGPSPSSRFNYNYECFQQVTNKLLADPSYFLKFQTNDHYFDCLLALRDHYPDDHKHLEQAANELLHFDHLHWVQTFPLSQHHSAVPTYCYHYKPILRRVPANHLLDPAAVLVLTSLKHILLQLLRPAKHLHRWVQACATSHDHDLLPTNFYFCLLKFPAFIYFSAELIQLRPAAVVQLVLQLALQLLASKRPVPSTNPSQPVRYKRNSEVRRELPPVQCQWREYRPA